MTTFALRAYFTSEDQDTLDQWWSKTIDSVPEGITFEGAVLGPYSPDDDPELAG